MNTTNKTGTILGITGKAGHGKNTVADLFVEMCPKMNFQRIAFADAVKRVYTLITGDAVQDSQEWKSQFVPEWGMTRREIFQKIGTDAMRDNLHADTWVKALFLAIKPGTNYLVTDVRFPNEADAIEAAGGKVVRVVRHGHDDPAHRHVSETALDGRYFDTIHNATLSMQFLREQVWLMAYANGWTNEEMRYRNMRDLW